MKKNVIKSLIKASKNEYAGNLKTTDVYKSKYFVDTGNYILNAVISGDMYKGIPSGKIIQWAGEKSTGKSFLTMNMVISHIKKSKDNLSLLFETEGGLIAESIEKVLSDEESERFLVFPCTTVEEVKENMNGLLEEIQENRDKYEQYNVLATIDSIGMPPSRKEKTEASDLKSKKDMTRATSISSLFRTVVMSLAKLNIPLNVVNHQYYTMDMWSPKKEAGGEKASYSPSVTLELRKKKLKDDKTKKQIGTSFFVIPKKSRIIAENISKIEIHSKFKIGMDRYSGLFEFLKNHNLLKKKSRGAKGGSVITIPELNISITTPELKKMKKEEFWSEKVLNYINKKFKEFYVLEMQSDDEIIPETESEGK